MHHILETIVEAAVRVLQKPRIRLSPMQVEAPTLSYPDNVHNYQRYTRVVDGLQIPYIVAGAGGYPAKHFMLSHPNGNKLEVPFKPVNNAANIVLENYNDTRFGYLIKIDKKVIEGQYIATVQRHIIIRPHADPEQVDNFEIDWPET